MERLCELLALHFPGAGLLADKAAAFAGDLGPAGHSVPLRVAAGLHALVLSGRAPGLAAVYPPALPDEITLLEQLRCALADHDAFLASWIGSAPQTNEIRRSAMLIAGAQVVASWSALPLRLSELGASGGLNLWWDHYALDLEDQLVGPPAATVRLTPEWTGPHPPDAHPIVAERRGVDLAPLDPTDPQDFLRLAAFLWPDQPDRLRLTRAGAQQGRAPVDKGDAIDWLEARLETAPDGQLHMIQNTVAWQYFPGAARSRGLALIEAAGRRATPDRPLAWLQVETDGDTTAARGAALTLRLWPGDIHIMLGRADFHGRWIAWQHKGTTWNKTQA